MLVTVLTWAGLMVSCRMPLVSSGGASGPLARAAGKPVPLCTACHGEHKLMHLDDPAAPKP